MSKGKTCAPRMTVISAAAIAALLLAGCSSGHIGDDWQCPLAAGGSCSSVAAADPAVPKTGAAQARVPGQPLRLLPREWDADRMDRKDRSAASVAATRSCEADCGFDPFAWLARLFGAEIGEDRPQAKDAKAAMTETAPAMAIASSAGSPAVEETPAGNHPGADDLRTGEVVARIWIAPFVDAQGVYREASHVRVVLEPAGWRLR